MTDLSLSSIAGFTVVVQALLSGHTIVVSSSHAPRDLFRQIEHQKVTVLATVPAVLRALVKSPAAEEFGLSSLVLIGIGGGHVSPELALAAQRRFRCEVAIGYGSTELGGGVLMTRPYDSKLSKVQSVGRPFPGVAVSVRGSKNQECDVGSIGELWCKSPAKMVGYLTDDLGVSESGEDAGWYRTHDLAVREPDGTIRIVGRSDEMIIRGGRKISPNEIESCVLAACALLGATIVDIAAAGVRGRHDEDTIHLWIVPDSGSGLTADRVRSSAAQIGPVWLVPQRVHIVDDLPRSAGGEVSRRELVLGLTAAGKPTARSTLGEQLPH
jgi:acyl-CoA synthetase (AMP-forming)/AMP-acid ligase II